MKSNQRSHKRFLSSSAIFNDAKPETKKVKGADRFGTAESKIATVSSSKNILSELIQSKTTAVVMKPEVTELYSSNVPANDFLSGPSTGEDEVSNEQFNARGVKDSKTEQENTENNIRHIQKNSKPSESIDPKKIAEIKKAKEYSFTINGSTYNANENGFSAKRMSESPQNYEYMIQGVKENNILKSINPFVVKHSCRMFPVLKPESRNYFAKLGNYSQRQNHYFDPSLWVANAASNFLATIFNDKKVLQILQEIRKNKEKPDKKYHAPCISFVEVKVEDMHFCLVAISGANSNHPKKEQVDLWNALNKIAKNLTDKSDNKFFMLDGATFELDATFAELLKGATGQIHDSLGKACSEKAFTSALWKLYSTFGSDVTVEGILNYDLQEDKFNDPQSHKINLSDKKSVLVRPIECCEQCQKNKPAVFAGFMFAQQWGDNPPANSRELQRVPSSPRSEGERSLYTHISELFAQKELEQPNPNYIFQI